MGSEGMLSREEAQAVVEACCRLLMERFGAQRVIPFGSVTGDTPWHARSDIDLAVEGLPPEQFFEALSAVQELAHPKIWVHLVSLEDATPQLRARILKEVRNVSNEPLTALKQLIEYELNAIERVAQEMDELLAKRADPPTRTELRAIASMLHDFYTGIEKIFQRLAVQLQEGLPRGEYWHMDLLNQMATAQAAGPQPQRPAVIDEPLRAFLKEYLDFRYLFRHVYGSQLEWVRLRLLAERMGETLTQLKRQLEAFFEARKRPI